MAHRLPFGPILFEETLALKASVADERDVSQLAPMLLYPKGRPPIWQTRGELVQQCEDIVLSLPLEVPSILSTTSVLA